MKVKNKIKIILRDSYRIICRISEKVCCLLRKFRAVIIYRGNPKKYVLKKWKDFYGYELNLSNPRTYNEKLQWFKIYGENSPLFGDSILAKKVADKLSVREYVSEIIGEKYLKRIYRVYGSTKEINFEELPDDFVLKNTHDSGSTYIVRNKDNVDKKALFRLECSLKIKYGLLMKEWVYKEVKPLIIAEELLKDSDNSVAKDYKVYCFYGVPKLIHVDVDRFLMHKRNIYDTSWNLLKVEIKHQKANIEIEKPYLLGQMLEFSSKLSKYFAHVRVDWFLARGKIFFGEMTFFPGSGFTQFYPVEWDYLMGEWINIPII